MCPRFFLSVLASCMCSLAVYVMFNGVLVVRVGAIRFYRKRFSLYKNHQLLLVFIIDLAFSFRRHVLKGWL